eukprot:gene2523-2764_t
MNYDTQKKLQKLINLSSNRTCADCGEVDPAWASLGFGIFICLNCAGYHRSLGVHITKVRSVRLDTWSEEQVSPMQVGGNEEFQKYLKSLALAEEPTIRGKYENPQLLYYTEVLKARVEGRDPLDFEDESWRALLGPPSSSSSPNPSQKLPPAVWIPDDTANGCMVCTKAFGFLTRRHHCRRCGKVCCADCAPANNSRPIMEWGLRDPVRHCKACYRSPLVQWKD